MSNNYTTKKRQKTFYLSDDNCEKVKQLMIITGEKHESAVINRIVDDAFWALLADRIEVAGIEWWVRKLKIARHDDALQLMAR